MSWIRIGRDLCVQRPMKYNPVPVSHLNLNKGCILLEGVTV